MVFFLLLKAQKQSFLECSESQKFTVDVFLKMLTSEDADNTDLSFQ